MVFAVQASAGWFDTRFGFPGAQGAVNSIVEVNDELWFVGQFTRIGGTYSQNVAKWDGTNWIGVRAGLNCYVTAAARFGAGLIFRAARGTDLAEQGFLTFDGQTWNWIGVPGDTIEIGAWNVSGAELYAELFTPTELFSYNSRRLARWKGGDWVTLADTSPVGSDRLDSIRFAQGALYAANGVFVVRDDAPMPIARLDGDQWTAIANNDAPFKWVDAMGSDGTNIFAVGWFVPAANAMPGPDFAMWNGNAWSVFPAAMRDNFFVGGFNDQADSILATEVQVDEPFTPPKQVRIVEYHGTNRTVIVKPDVPVSLMRWFKQKLICYGSFQEIGGVHTGNIAQWDGTHWAPLGEGTFEAMDGAVRNLATAGTNVYASGDFSLAGTAAANGIAKWDGNRWQPLGAGINGSIRQLVTQGSELFALGDFRTGSATNLARWDGERWTQFGSGLSGAPLALAATRDRVYLAHVDDTKVPGSLQTLEVKVSRWDGVSWETIGAGELQVGFGSPGIAAMVVTNNIVFIGGMFSEIDGKPVNNIAALDNGSWNDLAGGMRLDIEFEPNFYAWPFVDALAFFDGHLIAGGSFLTAGGKTVKHIAKWDGSAWSAVGDGIDAYFGLFTLGDDRLQIPVRSIVELNGKLYAAGSRGLNSVGIVWRLDGDHWVSIFDRGVAAAGIWALAAYGDDLFLAGEISSVGGLQSNGIALWHTSAALQVAKNAASVTLSWPRQFGKLRVEEASQPEGPWSALGNETSGINLDRIRMDLTVPNTNVFYRLNFESAR